VNVHCLIATGVNAGGCWEILGSDLAITGQERTAMLALARQMGVDNLVPEPWPSALGSFHPVFASRTSGPGNGCPGWTSAAARLISQPTMPSAAALVKASHPMASASETSTAVTVSTTVTRTKSAPRRCSEAISAAEMAGSTASDRARSKSPRTAPQARQPSRRGTMSRTE